MPKAIDDLPLVLTVEQVAEILSISRGAAYEAIRTGELPHVRIGRTIRIPRAMLATFLGEPLGGCSTENHPGATALPVVGSLLSEVEGGSMSANHGRQVGVVER